MGAIATGDFSGVSAIFSRMISSGIALLTPAAAGKVDLDLLQAMIDINAPSGSCGHWHVDSEPVTFPPPFLPEPHGAMIAVDQGQQPG
jgi:hypothetical protein